MVEHMKPININLEYKNIVIPVNLIKSLSDDLIMSLRIIYDGDVLCSNVD